MQKLLTITILTLLAACAPYNKYYDSGKPHHTRGGFKNQHISGKFSPTKTDYLRWLTGYGIKDLDDACTEQNDCEIEGINVVSPDMNAIKNPDPNKIQVTWIGHSTFLIQTGGINILTDPIFSKRASPVQFAGPKRIIPLTLKQEDLPPIDIVIISHNHYDHMDSNSVQHIGNGSHYIVPLGMKDWLSQRGITNTTELDWWQQAAIGKIKFNLVPAQHFSGRYIFDYNKTLWGGFVIETGQGNVYFAGDTGYSSDFSQIGKLYFPIKLALIPIGAYQPRWNNYLVHLNPADAVRVHQDLKAKQSIAMHWGTFDFTKEFLSDPAKKIKKAIKKANLKENEFLIMAIGETKVF